MDGERGATERQRAQQARDRVWKAERMWAYLEARREALPAHNSGRGVLDAPVVLRRVDGRTMQPPVRMGIIERFLRWVAGR